MRLEYRITFADVALFNAIHQFLSPLVQGLTLALSGLVFWSERPHAGSGAALHTAAGWYLAVWIAQFAVNTVQAWLRSGRSVLTDHVLELGDEGLAEDFNRSCHYWFGIHKLVSRPGFVAIYLTPALAHVIPARAFDSSHGKAAFVAEVRERMRLAVQAGAGSATR